VVEGSDDGRNWKAYEFRWKPGDTHRRPRLATPHMPRLDWLMWFAAMDRYQEHPWFSRFLVQLMNGSPPVVSLLAHNPFPASPPRYLRAVLYDYRFTSRPELSAEGTWWRRKAQRLYHPILRQPGSAPPGGDGGPGSGSGP
jgi:hypothetical protein